MVDGQDAGREGRQGPSAARTAVILVSVIGGVIAALALFVWYATPDTGETALSGHGVIAMVLGIVFSLIVGIGLMALVFYSSRRGYDEGAAVQEEDPSRPPDRPYGDRHLDDRSDR